MTNSMFKSLEYVRTNIVSAFSDQIYPGDSNITPYKCREFGTYKTPTEPELVNSVFSKQDWKNINFEYLKNHYQGDKSSCLAFMTYEAFRYYLPSYLLICVDSYIESDVIYNQTIIYLTKSQHSAEDFNKKFEFYDTNKKTSIAEFLLKMDEIHSGNSIPYYPEMEAFLSYWHQYI